LDRKKLDIDLPRKGKLIRENLPLPVPDKRGEEEAIEPEVAMKVAYLVENP
jgi:hypothetical protein